MAADWIFAGGTVRSPHDGWQAHGALAVAGDQVLCLGDSDQVLAWRASGTRVVDLAGGCLLPGFTDSHCHLLGYALARNRLDVAPARSLSHLQRLVAAAAAAAPPGGWVLGRGWSETGWPKGRLPARQDLDRVAAGRPVFLRRVCGHLAVASSQALVAAGIGAGTPDPPGGLIDRAAGGEPTGILRETAIDLVRAAVPSLPEARKGELLQAALAECLRLGICQVQTDDVESAGSLAAALRLYGQAAGPDHHPVRVVLAVPMHRLAEALAAGLRTGWGNSWLSVGHAKIFADGSLGGRTACLWSPYSDAPETTGLLVHEPQELAEQIWRAHAAGMQVGVHAIGDRAAAVTLDAIAGAMARQPRPDPRHRLIHCQVMGPSERRQAAALGVVGDIQPIFLNGDGRWFQERLGPERAAQAYAWQSLLAAGIPCAGGSDAPVEPLNPLYGIYCACQRRDLSGFPVDGWFPAERLTLAQAFDLYTRGGAYAAFAEGWRGTLAPGMVADLVILDRDPFRCDPDQILRLEVRQTMVGGQMAFSA